MKTIFVSSTFKDMQLERDVIQNIIAPKLNIIAREYGDEISFCDLRWGVDTSELESEEGSKKVLDVCLDEIDRCQPPMIVILGERYGWIPSENLVKDTAKIKKLELDHLKKSVTALEIEYGALKNKNNNVFFYYREIENEAPENFLSEDEEHKKLLNELKEKIKIICGDNIRTYKIKWNENGNYDLNDFMNMIYEDLKSYFMEQWSNFEKKTPFEKENYKHEIYAQEKNKIFRGRKELVENCLKSSKKNTYTYIKGEVGSGKSSLFSHLYHELKEENANIFLRFCSLTNKSDTATEILEQMIFYMENLLDISHMNFFENEYDITKKLKYFEELCNDYDLIENPCYFMIDAIDQLMEDQIKEGLRFIPTCYFDNVHFIITCINEFSLGMRSYIQVEDLNEKEKKEIIYGILESYNKEISKQIIELIVDKEMSKNPLYISFIIQRLTMMDQNDFKRIHELGDGIDAIIKHQSDILKNCPNTLKEMSIENLRIASHRINSSLIEKVTEYISVSRYGLRVIDLKGVIGDSFNYLDFSHFVSYMQNNFILRENGCYDFSHKSIREGYLNSLSEHKKQNIHQKLSDYLLTLDKDDPIRMDEVGYHMLMAEDIKNCTKYIEDFMYDKNLKYIRKFASCSKYCASLHESDWFANIISKMSPYVSGRAVVSFLNFDFFYTLKNTEKEKEIYRLALEESIKIVKKLKSESNTIANKIAHAIALNRLGDYQPKEVNPYDIYYEGLQYVNEILEEDNYINYRKRKATLLHSLALCNRKTNNIKDTFLKIEYFEEAISLLENIVKEEERKENYKDLAAVYDDYISFHSLGVSSFDKKYSKEYLNELRQKSSTCHEKIIELSKNSKSELARRYLSLANKKIKMPDCNEQEIINLLNKAESNYEHILEMYPTKFNYRNYGEALYYIANIYVQLYVSKAKLPFYREQVTRYFDFSIVISKELISKYNEIKDKENYFYNLMKEGNFYYKIGKEFYEEALDCYLEALKIDIEKNLPKSNICNFIGDIYRFYKKEEIAISYYEKADYLYEKSREENEKVLHYAYAEVREILKDLGPFYTNRVPEETMELIEACYSRLYKVPFKGREWIHAKKLDETNVILSIFNVNFWSDNKKREEYLKKIEKSAEE